MGDLRNVIPGLAEAQEQEQLIRDAAFLVETETICGFELRPLTLRDLLALRVAKSPFLIGGTPSPQQIADFIWRLSENFNPRDKFAQRRVQEQCEKFIPPKPPYLKTPKAIRKWKIKTQLVIHLNVQFILQANSFVMESLRDLPAASNSGAGQSPLFSIAAALCGDFGREYGWSPDTVLDMPIKRITQFIREIQCRRLGDKARTHLFNPLSDGVKRDFLSKRNGE